MRSVPPERRRTAARTAPVPWSGRCRWPWSRQSAWACSRRPPCRSRRPQCRRGGARVAASAAPLWLVRRIAGPPRSVYLEATPRPRGAHRGPPATCALAQGYALRRRRVGWWEGRRVSCATCSRSSWASRSASARWLLPATPLVDRSLARRRLRSGAPRDGWALLACGAVAWTRRPASRFGAILAAAGCAWFLVEFNNPGVGSALLFTVGLLTYAACPAVAAHASLAYPGGPSPTGSNARCSRLPT